MTVIRRPALPCSVVWGPLTVSLIHNWFHCFVTHLEKTETPPNLILGIYMIVYYSTYVLPCCASHVNLMQLMSGTLNISNCYFSNKLY